MGFGESLLADAGISTMTAYLTVAWLLGFLLGAIVANLMWSWLWYRGQIKGAGLTKKRRL